MILSVARNRFEPVPGLLRQATDVGEGVPARITAQHNGVRFTLVDNSFGRPKRIDVDVPISDVEVERVGKRTANIVVDGEQWIFTAHDPIRVPLSPSETVPTLPFSVEILDPIRKRLRDVRVRLAGSRLIQAATSARRSVALILATGGVFVLGFIVGGAVPDAPLLTAFLVIAAFLAGNAWSRRHLGTASPASELAGDETRERTVAVPVSRDPVQEALSKRLAEALAKIGTTPEQAIESGGLPENLTSTTTEDAPGDSVPPSRLDSEADMAPASGPSDQDAKENVRLLEAVPSIQPDSEDPDGGASDTETTAEPDTTDIDQSESVIDSAVQPADVVIVREGGPADEPAGEDSDESPHEDIEEQAMPLSGSISLRREEARRALATLEGNIPDHEMAPADNLELIHGVGPTYAAILIELGYPTLESVAAMSDQDLEEIGEHVGPLRWRIEREGWIDSARELLEAEQAAVRGDQ
jgi:predicted flap endonuclease-1-like 5' DNA nuclease